MNAPLPLQVRVQARVQEAQDIVSFELASLDGAPLPAFGAGAHVDVEAAPATRFDLAATIREASPDTHLYVCGPAGFIDAVTGEAAAQGWSAERVHREYFAAPVPVAGGDRAFVVRIPSRGQALAVPAGKSALAVLLEAGIDIPISCEQGICGTCVTRVLAGVPEHRDHYLSDEEKAANEQFTPCCSRAASPELVLDL